jgi:alcohol dehydrogenase (cytochrome c)
MNAAGKSPMGAALLWCFAGMFAWTAYSAPLSFTNDQVNKGRQVYRQRCADCHGARLEGQHPSPALTGARFDLTWRGKTADVLAFHVRRMPPAAILEPGTLSDDDYTNVLAYVLQYNGFEPGEDALPTDIAALQGIKLPALEGATHDPFVPVSPTPEQAALLANLPPVTDEMLRDPAPEDWLQWGRTYNGHNFSPLNEINRETVKDLKPAWRAPLRPGTSMAAPLVHAGVMYLHAFPDTVVALDATNGAVLWRYQHEPKGGSSQKMGLGLHGEKVLVPTSDLHVLALNAKSGALIWDHPIETEVQGGYQLRSAPVVVGDKVLQGVTASFVSKGGFMVGLDVNTGDECWRFNSIPRPGEFGSDSWNDVPIERRSGGSVWHLASYDPELNLIYYGIAPTYDTGPLLHPVSKEGVTSEALYTNCTVALNPDTGDLAWHYQHMANDQWDLDWVFERQIAEVTVNGEKRKAVINVGKMAILEAVDAETGEYLFSVDSGIQNVVSKIDPKTGEKTIDMTKWPDPERPCVVTPSAVGARAWPLTSYNPETGLAYLPLTKSAMEMGQEGMRLLTSGVGIGNATHPDAEDGTMGRIQAIDVANQKRAWAYDNPAPIMTGMLSTAGNVVFGGDMVGSLKALDADTGDLMWETILDDIPSSNIVTYAVGETQYVAVMVGIRNLHIDFMLPSWNLYANEHGIEREAPMGGAGVWVFSL